MSGVRRRVGRRTERCDQRLGGDGQRGREQHADDQGQPDAVDALGDRGPQVAGADPAGDGGRGAVGEEDADRDGRREQRAGDAEPGQLRGAEVTDDGRVDEQEQRLGDEGAEGGDGEPEDLPVLDPAAGPRGGSPGRATVRMSAHRSTS